MALPAVTALQFAVLRELLPGPLGSQEIARRLRKLGYAPTKEGQIYSLLNRMESMSLVTGQYRNTHDAAGKPVRRRIRKITASGRREMLHTRSFYCR